MKICLTALLPNSLIRIQNIIQKLRKSFAAYGHNLSKLAINQIQFAPIEPKTAAVFAMIQNDIRDTQEPHSGQIKILASGTFSDLFLRRFVFLFRTEFNTSSDLESHLVQFMSIQP